MGKNWYKEKKSEGFYKMAKREGYRARSAYKLLQIQERHNVLHEGDTVIDLGAAPGSWSQVATQIVGDKGRVIGVDLQHVTGMPGAEFVRGDFTLPETIDKIFGLLVKDAKGPRIDVVLSDMSPNLTGNYTMDQANSVFLSMHAVRFARRALDAGGKMVVKVFEGEDYKDFLADVKTSFTHVKPYNPAASRKQSSEIYLIATGFKPTRRAAPTASSASGPGPPSS
jgi:23S rRNA (uridine2552-2'-O)-methyltransferase